ncbi:hypothetical protein N7466_001336 [Penicillium verhagenii]|uniref:uncharacterized protein n=1 Tax=Penicillium verhagenii TaxID=1562060 RepID=UPI0025458C2B|nr:uncharacterized protein N7466_001336 [Penicillium verhagenii]KAJ5948321.1 hypothetical protein N7466_001336 [Penicillium verhagenii]
MARLTIIYTLLSSFTNYNLRQGPFFYSLTDLHPSNIFASSLPTKTLRAPYWLTGLSIDNIIDKHLETFKATFNEFLDIFQEEEKSFPPISSSYSYYTGLIRRGFRTNNF